MKSFVMIAAFAATTLAGCGGETEVRPVASKPIGSRASVGIRTASVNPYPQATQVRLVITTHDAPPIPDAAGRLLTAAERARFEATLRHEIVVRGPNSAPSASGPACFIPHHFFRYLDAGGNEIGLISVCFCCSGVSAAPLLPFQTGPALEEEHRLRIDQAAAEAFVAGLGLPTDVGCRPVTPPAAAQQS